MDGAFINVVFFILPLTSCANQSCHNKGTVISALLSTVFECYRVKMAPEHQTAHHPSCLLPLKDKRNQWQVILVREHRLNIKATHDHTHMGSGQLDVRPRGKSATQFLKLSYQSKLCRQNRSTTQTFSFFIRNFSMLRTLTLKCGSRQSSDKQDFTVPEHAETNLYIDISISTGRSRPPYSQPVQKPPHHNLTPPSKASNRPLMTLTQAYLLSRPQWPWQHSQSRSNWKPAPWVQNPGCWEGYQLCPSQHWMWPQTDSWLTAQQTHLSVYHTLGDLVAAWPARGNTWEKDYKKGWLKI